MQSEVFGIRCLETFGIHFRRVSYPEATQNIIMQWAPVETLITSIMLVFKSPSVENGTLDLAKYPVALPESQISDWRLCRRGTEDNRATGALSVRSGVRT